GLTQVLQGSGPMNELVDHYVLPSGVERLDILPSGPRQANPAELLAGPRLAELLAWAESVYDQILIDAPPAVAAADASIIAAITDGLILVVRPESNRRQAVVRTVEGFRSVGVQPFGIVVNGLGGDVHGYYSYTDSYGYGLDGDSQDNMPNEDHFTEENVDRPISMPVTGLGPANNQSPVRIIPRRAA
ncbi:MAG: hypothetical protein JW829_02755, partial [Pirellulales bacterium]|nr:hypothetical protein [Pirellulales bacterium]